MKKEEINYIYENVKPYLLRLVFGILLIVVSTFFSLINPYITKVIIDKGLLDQNYEMIVKCLLFMVTIFGLSQFLSIIQSYNFTYIHQHLLYKLRMELYHSVSKKENTFFNEKQTGELISRITNELPQVVNLFSTTLVELVTQTSFLIITFVIMFRMNKIITLLTISVVPFIFCALRYYNPKFRMLSELSKKTVAKFLNSLEENLSNIKMIKYGRYYKFSELRLSKEQHEIIRRNYDQMRLNISSNLILSILFFSPNIFLFAYGGYQTIQGRLSVGSLVALSAYISKLFSPIRTLSTIDLAIQNSMVSFRRYLELVKNVKKDMKTPKLGIEKEIKIENLTFFYDERKHKIFNELNIELKKGGIVQIIGDNGTGKTTLIDLILNLLEVKKGSIKLDNVKVDDIDDFSLQKIVGIVPQNIYLFSETVRNNIKVGRDINDKKILRLAKELNFDDIVESEGINLETFIFNNGGNLSGGQKQKICILRALIGEPALLILDEADAYLDVKSKLNFYNFIKNTKDNRITIFVSHKEQPFLKPDRIISLPNSNLQSITYYLD